MTGARRLTLPRALWFFFNSQDAPINLARETLGYGWRAAMIDAWRPPFLALAPSAPLAMPLLRWPWLYRRAWPLAQWALGVAEASLSVDVTAWHCYELAWGRQRATWTVDGQPMLVSKTPPPCPLGLVLWIDNQAMTVQPWTWPRHRLLAVSQPQWLELGRVAIST
jgi:hypothetical protein